MVERKSTTTTLQAVQRGFNFLADQVKETLGPKGKGEALEKIFGPLMVTLKVRDVSSARCSIKLDGKSIFL